MIKDPNFPENLNIIPSSNFASAKSTGTAYNLNFGREAQKEAIRKYGIAGRVWEAAYVLDQYIHPPLNWTFDPPFLEGTRDAPRKRFGMIELGSGVGLIGAAIADVINPTFDYIIVTDLPQVCPLLEANLESHPQRSMISVRPLSWGNEVHASRVADEFFHSSSSGPPLTHIICSDLIYFPELLSPLLRTLIHLTSSTYTQHPNRCTPHIIISYKIRSLAKETPFWSAFGLYFSFRPVLVQVDPHKQTWERFCGKSAEDATFLFVAERRPESQTWRIPKNDNELLSGVGAWDTVLPKNDDTFESLLFMSLGGDDDDDE